MIAFKLFVLNSLSESLFRFFSSFEQPFFENITIIMVLVFIVIMFSIGFIYFASEKIELLKKNGNKIVGIF